jgi:hypothetical protein
VLSDRGAVRCFKLDDLGFEREELERRGVWEGGLLISRGTVVLLGLFSFDLVNWDGYSFYCPSKHSVLPEISDSLLEVVGELMQHQLRETSIQQESP